VEVEGTDSSDESGGGWEEFEDGWVSGSVDVVGFVLEGSSLI